MTTENLKPQCPYCGGINGNHIWAGSECPGARQPQGRTYLQGPATNVWPMPVQQDGYEVAKIYQEARERLLEELKAQVEVNRLLTRDLIDARLKLAQFKLKHGIGPAEESTEKNP